MDCTTEEGFDVKLHACITEWKQMRVSDSFINYFYEKAELNKARMNAEIISRAGLGNPQEIYRQQRNINNVVKRDLKRPPSLFECVNTSNPW